MKKYDPRKAVLRRIASDYDRFATEEQVLVAEGRYIEAQGAHEFALQLLRAYRAEQDDPEPAEAPCHMCGGVRACDIYWHQARRAIR